MLPNFEIKYCLNKNKKYFINKFNLDIPSLLKRLINGI